MVEPTKRDQIFKGKRGKRRKRNQVLVRLGKNGQFSATVPVWLAELLDLKKGSVVKWDVEVIGGRKKATVELVA